MEVERPNTCTRPVPGARSLDGLIVQKRIFVVR